jgi:predicted MFS family arabinose efflux permease
MISGGFPHERRAFAQSIFASGMLLGGACGQVLGGLIGPRYGWQEALFVVSVLGVIPGLALFWVEEPPRGPRSDVVPILSLLSVPAFLAMIGAGICITFSTVSILTWGIDFAMNYKDFTLREASISVTLITFVSLVLGVLMGGLVADRLQKRFAYGRIIAVASAFLLAAPFLLLAIQSEEKRTVLIGLAMAGFFMSWYHGPVTAVLHDMMPRRAHATSIGVYMFATQLVGGLGPQVIGKISDLRDLQLGLQIAVAVMVCGALLMLLVIHFIRRDGLRHPTLDIFHAEPTE